MFSPVVTIGGGTVLDIEPPRRGGVERLEILEKGTNAERVALVIKESKFGMGLPELIARTGLLEQEILEAVQTPALLVFHEPRLWAVDAEWGQGALNKVQDVLKQFHREKPLLAGISKEEVRSRVLPGAPSFLLDALLGRSKTIAVRAETVHLASHKVALKEDESDALAKIEAAFAAAGLAVPSTAEVLAGSGVEGARAKTLLQILLRDKKLVRVSDSLVFHRAAIDSLHTLLSAHRGERFGVNEFKEWTGVSRKYAIPLLEFLDRERVTRREGDVRLVLT